MACGPESVPEPATSASDVSKNETVERTNH
jgi:hypothetical protein